MDTGTYHTGTFIAGSNNGRGNAMKILYDPIVAEMRQIKESHLDIYGSWEAFNKHIDEMRSSREAQGWHYETTEERAKRLARHKKTNSL
jgi:hypothetical protein